MMYIFSLFSHQVSMRYLAMDTCQLLSGTGASQQSNLMSILLPLEKLLKEQHRALVTDTPWVAEAWGWCNTSTPHPHTPGQLIHVTLLQASVTELPFLGIWYL